MDKKESSSWLKRTWGKIKGWNWQKIGGFGGLLGLVVAVFTLICVAGELQTMKENQELEYRGFLSIYMEDVRAKPGTGRLDYTWRWYQADRVPALTKGESMWMTSRQRGVDLYAWMAKNQKETQPRIEHVEPVFYEESRPDSFAYSHEHNRTLWELDSIFFSVPYERLLGFTQKFYLHVIYKYEDLRSQNYWVYMRWELLRICTDTFTLADTPKFATHYKWVCDDYVVWQAKPDECLPSKFPKKLASLVDKTQRDHK